MATLGRPCGLSFVCRSVAGFEILPPGFALESP